MLRKISLTFITMSSILTSFSQDSTTTVVPKLTVTGSVDAYYRYNFNNPKNITDNGSPVFNNYTSFTNSSNSFELGMASVKFDYNTGKVGVVADLGFGSRADEFSYNDKGTTLTAIKQAYVTYSPSDKLKFTFGKFGTHVGYELLDPQLNRNYSMSYMFSYGPFFHTGLKADISISDNFGFMVGVANPTDYVSAPYAKKYLLAQIHGTTAGGKLAAYLNYVGGEDSDGTKGNQIDAVVTGKLSDKFSIGYNGTVKSVKAEGETASWWGSAVYLNVDPSSKLGITLRGEYFDDKKDVAGLGTSFFSTTLSFNIKPLPNLTILPEFRLDSAKDETFYKKTAGEFSKSAASFILAAIISF